MERYILDHVTITQPKNIKKNLYSVFCTQCNTFIGKKNQYTPDQLWRFLGVLTEKHFFNSCHSLTSLSTNSLYDELATTGITVDYCTNIKSFNIHVTREIHKDSSVPKSKWTTLNQHTFNTMKHMVTVYTSKPMLKVFNKTLFKCYSSFLEECRFLFNAPRTTGKIPNHPFYKECNDPILYQDLLHMKPHQDVIHEYLKLGLYSPEWLTPSTIR